MFPVQGLVFGGFAEERPGLAFWWRGIYGLHLLYNLHMEPSIFPFFNPKDVVIVGASADAPLSCGHPPIS